MSLWRKAQITLMLCLAWLDSPQKVAPAQPKRGDASHYCRRREADSQLDPERFSAEQVNLLRVLDNKRYPPFFEWRGRRHVLQVESYNKDDIA